MSQPQSSRGDRWQAFASLDWFDAILDFLFQLTAKSSEVLLAAGVILSTANHFQQGSLFTTTIMEHGKPVLVSTLLFQIWTWTQAIGFEASAGVVLAAALDAHRNRDVVKRNVLLLLMGGLALVGTTMLVMAFIEASTSFKEQDLPAAYSITMSILRGVVSVAYVTIGRVKNRRFSGPDVVSCATIPDLLTQMTDISEQLRQMGANTEHRIQQLEAKTERHQQHITGQLSELSKQHREQIQRLTEQFGAFTETAHRSLSDMTILLQEGKQDESTARQLASLMAALEDCMRVVEALPDLAASLGQIEETTASQLRVVVEEVTQVKTTLLQQKQELPKPSKQHRSGREHVLAEEDHAPLLLPNVRHLSRANTEAEAMTEYVMRHSVNSRVTDSTESSRSRSATTEFEKGTFVRTCLIENPNLRNMDIQRKAAEIGQTISPAYISEIRKAFFAEARDPLGSASVYTAPRVAPNTLWP